MLGLFVTLGIAILTLIVILLWFVPHLLQQQAHQSANESAQLREMLFDLLNEQEAVTARQGKIGTSVFHLQEQLERIVNHDQRAQYIGQTLPDRAELHALEQRIAAMQAQVETILNTSKMHNQQDNESWAYLLSLLAAIMDRIRELSTKSPGNVGMNRNANHEHHCHR